MSAVAVAVVAVVAYARSMAVSKKGAYLTSLQPSFISEACAALTTASSTMHAGTVHIYLLYVYSVDIRKTFLCLSRYGLLKCSDCFVAADADAATDVPQSNN